MRAVPGDTVGFAKVDGFEGPENDAVDAVIVFDLPEPRFWQRGTVSHYVAMVIRDPCWREFLNVHRIAL